MPADYEESGRRYPVVYVDGSAALESGDWSLALDHLVGDRIEEIIVVFGEWPGRPLQVYSSFYSETIFPLVDETTAPRREPSGEGWWGSDPEASQYWLWLSNVKTWSGG